MDSFDSVIPLPSDCKSFFFQAIANAHKNDIQTFSLEYELETFNSVHFLTWDFTNKNLIRKFNGSRFQCVKVRRGPWTFILIYDIETKFLYSLIRRKRFIQLQERITRENVHYIDGLASLNVGLKGKDSKERFFLPDLFDMDGESWALEVQNVLKETIQQVQGEIKQYVLVLFSTEKGEVTSFTACIPSINLGIAYEEDWSEFITPDFSDNYSDKYSDDNEEEEDEIKLNLRDNDHKQQSNLSLRDGEIIKDGGDNL